LHDDGQEITEDKINAVVKGAGITIEPYWASLFSKFLQSKPVEELISNVGGGGGGGSGGGGGGSGGGGGGGGGDAGGGGGGEAAKEEAVEEEEEDMGFDLFD